MSTAPSARPPRSGSPERRARGVTPASVPAARRNSLRGATRAATMSRGDELAVPALWHAPGRDCSLLGLRPFLHLLLDLPQLQALGGAGSRLLRPRPGAGATHRRRGTAVLAADRPFDRRSDRRRGDPRRGQPRTALIRRSSSSLRWKPTHRPASLPSRNRIRVGIEKTL